MGVTVLLSSLPSPRGGADAAAPSRACASRLRLDPACIRSSAVAAKEPKRPRSFRDDERPTKRHREAGDAGVAATQAMSLEENNGVNRLPLSLFPSGSTLNEVIPLSDSIVRVLQEKGTRSRGGRDDEVEIDVHPLGDDALRVIKGHVGTYLEDRAQREEAPSQSKEGVIGQSKARSFPSKAASKCIPSKAASKSITPRVAPTNKRPRAALTRTPLNAASKTILPSAVPTLPALPKPSESRDSVCELVKTAFSQSPPRSTQPTASPSLLAPPKPLGSKKSMKELLADASKVMKTVVRRGEIEKLRAAARRELEQVVRTVEFNDPYIDPQDVFK